jgi:DNA polymerase-3 subunit beta
VKLTVNRPALLKALEPARRVSASKSTIPILSNILLAVEDGKLRIEATDLDMVLSVAVAADVETAGSVTVPVGTLYDLVRKLPDGASIVLEASEGMLSLRSGRTRAKIATLPAEDWPDVIKDDNWRARFSMSPDSLAGMLARTEFAISSDETRYYLNGAFMHCIEIEGRRMLRMVTTDGHRLARIETPAPDGTADMPAVIVPRKAGAEIGKLCKGASEITIALSQNKMRVDIGDVRLSTKLIDGTYPDYSRVIPANNDKRATLNRAAFASAADRVSVVATERGRAVRLTFDPGRLVLSVTSADQNSAVEEIEATYDGPPIEIGFKSRYLADILQTIEGGDVRVSMSDAGSPALLQSTASDALLIVLMPMRIQGESSGERN